MNNTFNPARLASFSLHSCWRFVRPASDKTREEPQPEETAVAQSMKQPHVEHSASRMASPETELEEALSLSQRLTERDLRSALHLFADSARRFASSGQPQRAAIAELEAGDVYLMMSRYQEALAAYRQALTMSGGHVDQRCAALSRIARTYANIGRPHDSQQNSDQAVSVCMTMSNKKAQADALEAQGEMRFWSGNVTDAITSFTQARELASEAGDRDGEGLATMMLSGAIDDHQQANRLAWSALGGFVETDSQYNAARARLKLAYLASAGGDFEAARCHCQSALPVFQRIDDKDNAAIALNILGMVARQSGDLEESLSDYRRAKRDFASVQDDLGEAESISAIGEILLSQHKYGDLEPLYLRKLHLAQTTSNRAFLAWAFLDMAGVYARQHRYAQANENYQRKPWRSIVSQEILMWKAPHSSGWPNSRSNEADTSKHSTCWIRLTH